MFVGRRWCPNSVPLHRDRLSLCGARGDCRAKSATTRSACSSLSLQDRCVAPNRLAPRVGHMGIATLRPLKTALKSIQRSAVARIDETVSEKHSVIAGLGKSQLGRDAPVVTCLIRTLEDNSGRFDGWSLGPHPVDQITQVFIGHV